MPTTRRPTAPSRIWRSADAAPPRSLAEGPARQTNSAAPPRPQAEGPARQASSAALLCVDPARVAEIWPHVEPLLAQAYREGADDTLAAIEADVPAGESLLWVVWDDAITAAATTKIMRTPTRKVLRVECCAGRDVARWIGFIRALEDYGRRQGCEVCRVEGRKGWRAMLTDYREPWIVLEKVL